MMKKEYAFPFYWHVCYDVAGKACILSRDQIVTDGDTRIASFRAEAVRKERRDHAGIEQGKEE